MSVSIPALPHPNATLCPARSRISSCLTLAIATAICLSACKPHPVQPASSTPPPDRVVTNDGPPIKFAGIAQARIEKGYAVVVFENGRKGMFPFSGLQDAEREWLQDFANAHPLAHGNSTVIESHAEAKKTMVRQTKEGTTEVVQLCPPAIMRDQIGGTCALYARVHFLDIAGYPLDNAALYKVIDKSPVNDPWQDPLYRVRLDRLYTEMVPAPILHYPRNVEHPFDWAREQIRLGRPVMAQLPEDIWQALPASFLATHPWDGAKVGHAVVINGFTFDSADPQKNTFHVINSWRELGEFDVPADVAAKNVVVIQESLSPKGEVQVAAEQVIITKITELNAVGKQFLFSVETNLGVRRVVAANEDAARRLIDDENQPTQKVGPAAMPTEAETQAERVNAACDEITRTLPRDVQEAAFSDVVSQITHQPKTGKVPRLDATLRQKSGSLYFVRVSPDLVLKIAAQTTAEALEIARSRKL